MAQKSEPGYVCFLRLSGTNIYKFSYTTQDPEKRIQQVLAENPDLNFDECRYIPFQNIKAAENKIRESFKAFEYKEYGGREKCYKFRDDMSIKDVKQNVLSLFAPRKSKNPTSTQTNDDSSGCITFIVIAFFIASVLAGLNSNYQKCVNNGGGNACENINK